VEVLPCTYELLGNLVQSKTKVVKCKTLILFIDFTVKKLALYLSISQLLLISSLLFQLAGSLRRWYFGVTWFNLLDYSDVGTTISRD